MASIDSQSQTPSMEEKVQLKVMFDKENNRVLWAEAGKDFVDVLFSFLTLPLGTIARLVSQKSNMEPAVRVGSLSALYQSVVDLKEQHLWSETFKEMLLWPRSSMETYCQNMKLKIDDTPMEYFICSGWKCNRTESGALLSIFRNQKCSCGKVMEKEVSPDLISENGFVKQTASFIICDDLHVIPSAFGTSMHLLQKFGVQNFDAIDEQMVDITKNEVIDLLKLSFLSKTPLTDLISKKQQMCPYFIPNLSHFVIQKEKETSNAGGVMHMLEASSSLNCLDNLHKSLTELSPDKFLLSKEVKDKLTKPQCFPKFELNNQILPIGVASLPVNYCLTYYSNGDFHVKFTKEKGPYGYNRRDYPEKTVPLKLVDPKFSISKSSGSGEFVTGPSLYMVTDNLIVTPMQPSSALSHLSKSKVSLSDLEERVIEIGTNEGLSILKASLISTSALTIGLKQFISIVKEEK